MDKHSKTNAFDEARDYLDAQTRRAQRVSLSTLRIRLKPQKLCLMIDLFEKLGGVSDGRSLASLAQELFDNLLAQKVKDGTVAERTESEAAKELLRRRTRTLSDLNIDNFELSQEKDGKDEFAIASRLIAARIALDKVQNEEPSSESIEDLFGIPEDFKS